MRGRKVTETPSPERPPLSLSVGPAPTPPRERVPFERIAVGLILLTALAVRLVGIARGLPYIHEWDEPYVVTYVIGMVQRGDLDPKAFSYPSLYFYILLPVTYLYYFYLHLSGHAASPFAIQLFHPQAPISHLPPTLPYWWYINEPSFYLWARIVTTLLATAAVFLVYRLGRATFGIGVGLLAAALLAVAPGFVYYADTVRVDVPMVFFLCAAVLAGLRVLEGGTPRDYLIAGALGGLAMSTKQAAFVIVIAFVTAHALNPRRRRFDLRPLVTLGAGVAGGFVAGTPRILVTPRYLVDVWASEGRAYGGVPTLASLKVGAAQNLLYFVHPMQGGSQNPEWYVTPHAAFGLIPASAAVLGLIVASVRKPRLALYLGSFMVPYFCLMASQRNFFLRSMIPLLPFAAVFAAVGTTWIGEQCRRTRALRGGLSATVAATLGILILLAEPTDRAVHLAWLLRHDEDTRTEAVAWVRAHARPGEVVAFDANLRWFLPALRDLPVEVVYTTPDRDLAWCRANGVNLAVVGRLSRLADASLVTRIARPAYLDGGGDESGNDGDLVISPTIRIVSVSGR